MCSDAGGTELVVISCNLRGTGAFAGVPGDSTKRGRPVARSIMLLAGAGVPDTEAPAEQPAVTVKPRDVTADVGGFPAAALNGPAFAQGPQQTVALMKVDPQTVATGYRASKLVGDTVVNEANETGWHD